MTPPHGAVEVASPDGLDHDATRDPAPTPPATTPRELARWAWRQLTSMRTALLLLLLLALASVPGSVVPQQGVDAMAVTRWRQDHPGLAPVYDRLGLFSVYSSPWFSAVYLLLVVSLVGCILPRTAVYWRALRAAPPAAPRNLSRLPAYARAETAGPGDTAEAVLQRARAALGRRYRVSASSTPGAGSASIAAERGHLREAGNLLFHVAVVAVLLAFGVGQLFGYKGGSIVLVGGGFTNALTQYDDFVPGALFDPEDLAPLTFTVDDFDVAFLPTGPQAGQPIDFAADLSYRTSLDAPARDYELQVNEPLVLDGVSVFLVGHGYAPVLTVTDGSGEEVFSGPAVFLPQDASFASYGVVKVPGAEPQQLGLEGFFLPTYSFTPERGPFSVFPDAVAPRLSLTAYAGDLGLDDGRPQSVYDLDTDRMTKVEGRAKRDLRAVAPGETVRLPDGLGTVRFDGWQRWVKLQVSHTPAKGAALGAVVLALAGLMTSLFVRRRRLWVRVGDGFVEVAGLDRGVGGDDLDREVRALAAAVRGTADTGEQEVTRDHR